MLCRLYYALFIPSFFRAFYPKGFGTSLKDFSALTEIVKWFLILSLFIDYALSFLSSSQNSPHTTLFFDCVPITIARLLVRALKVANLFCTIDISHNNEAIKQGSILILSYVFHYRRLKNTRNLPELTLPICQDRAISGTACKG